jgi:hypothetical protein
MKFIGLIATFAGAIVLAVIAVTPAAARQSVIDPKLVGTWTRTVSKADVQREEAYGGLAGAHCTLTVKMSGASHIACPGQASVSFSGPITSKGTNHVQISLGDLNPNTYKWHVAGRLLTLTKLKDSNPDRSATMSGVWKRK